MEKVLIVEDEARIRNIIFDYFSAHGLICDIARNGEEALDILRDNDYDAILLDILMPEGLQGSSKKQQCADFISHRFRWRRRYFERLRTWL